MELPTFRDKPHGRSSTKNQFHGLAWIRLIQHVVSVPITRRHAPTNPLRSHDTNYRQVRSSNDALHGLPHRSMARNRHSFQASASTAAPPRSDDLNAGLESDTFRASVALQPRPAIQQEIQIYLHDGYRTGGFSKARITLGLLQR